MSIPADMIERARDVRIEDEVERRGIRLRGNVERVGPCPICGGDDRFAVHTRKQVFHCRGCAVGGDVIRLVMHIDGCDFREAVETLTGGHWRPSTTAAEPSIIRDAVKVAPCASDASAKRIAAEMRPLMSAPIALAYFDRVRKIDVAAIEDILSRIDAIGWHPAVYFNGLSDDKPPHPLHGQQLGCIVGIMTDAKTAEPTGAISRTYLAPDGSKVGKAKTLGSPIGVVRLTPDDEVLEGLCLAEGLETALSGMAIGLRPMWSTGSASMMARFPLLNGIEAINVIVDHDASGAGERAAREVEARWLAPEREVNLLRSAAPGDLNDALRGIL